MIQITIKTNNVRKNVVESINETPRSIFAGIGITPSTRNQVTLSGVVLDDEDFDKTFAELGVEEDEDVVLASVVKGDGA